MNEHDISSIFKSMEEHLLSSMSRNMQRHTNWENDEGFQWKMWQAKQFEALSEYQKQNKRYVNKHTGIIQKKIEELLKQFNEHGGMQQEIKILEAIYKGFKPGRTPKGIQGSFFKLNERKLNAMIKAVNSDMKKATTAMLRMSNDEYRKTIYKAQVFANTGTMTTDQAIDMATKDYLAKGINCIEYSNGRRVNIAAYAEMAIRTANKRAYLQGEGAKRDEWGIHTVLVSRYGACSPTCLPWQGKVYIDDVWSGGTAEEAKKLGYPLLSTAIAGGLFHPNCKHTISTYFEGISTRPTAVDVKGTQENSNLVATQRYNERQIRKYKRLEKNSLDERNKAKYATLRKQWQAKQRKLIGDHPEMHRNYKREDLRGVYKMDLPTDSISDLNIDDIDIPFSKKSVPNIKNDDSYVNKIISTMDIKTTDKNIINLIKSDLSLMPKEDLEFLMENSIPILKGNEKRGSYRITKNRFGITKEEIFIRPDAPKGTFAHEFAHFIANKTDLYEKDEFLDIIENAVKNSSLNVLKIKKDEFIAVKSDKFISAYQGRTYFTPEQFKMNGEKLALSDLKEYVSVGYQHFVTNPQLLYEKDRMLYDYFKKGGLAHGKKN